LITEILQIRKVASTHVQVAWQPHESKKLNLVAPEKSSDFSYAIKNVSCWNRKKQYLSTKTTPYYNV